MPLGLSWPAMRGHRLGSTHEHRDATPRECDAIDAWNVCQVGSSAQGTIHRHPPPTRDCREASRHREVYAKKWCTRCGARLERCARGRGVRRMQPRDTQVQRRNAICRGQPKTVAEARERVAPARDGPWRNAVEFDRNRRSRWRVIGRLIGFGQRSTERAQRHTVQSGATDGD